MATSKQLRTRGPDGYEREPRKSKLQRTRGRPSDFDESVVYEACLLAQHGATDAEIAAALQIAQATLYRWFNQYPHFREAIISAKAAVDARVERTLFQRATGYQQTVEKVFANGTRMKVIEEVAPDPTSMIFWLKNRRPQQWRDRRETEIVVPESSMPSDEPDQRQLALAALALLNEAAHSSASAADAPVIEAVANEVEDGDAQEDADDETASVEREAYDPDFDD